MKSSYPSVYVVILNYNGKDTLSQCLSCVYQSNYKNFEVVVVDNNSEDGSFEQARKDFSRTHFIKNSENIGFSKGNNLGIRFALEKFADYVFVLNNDALIGKQTISQLVSEAEKDPVAGILCPLTFENDSKQLWFAGGKILWKKMQTVHLTEIEGKNPYETQYISGCAMLIKKDVFRKIGLFDERFFLYYEDADLSFRATKEGFKLLVVPSAQIKHFEQSNEKNTNKIYWLVLSGLLFFKIHSSGAEKIWLFFFVMLRKIKNIYKLLFHCNKEVQQVRKAYRDFKKLPA